MLHIFHSTLPAEQLLSQTDTLAVLSYENTIIENFGSNAAPSLRVAEISGQECLEVWKLSEEIVASGVENNCSWRRSDNFQFITITAPLSEQDDFEQISYSVYRQILNFIEQSPHRELLRFGTIFHI